MREACIISIVLAMTFSSAGIAADFSTAIQLGDKAVGSQNYRYAIAAYFLATQKQPNNQLAHFKLANVLLKSKNDWWNREDALRHYRQAYAANPTGQVALESLRQIAVLQPAVELPTTHVPDSNTSAMSLNAPASFNSGALPPIAHPQKTWFSAAEVRSWNLPSKAQMVSQALQGLTDAKAWQTRAEENLRRAQSVVKSTTPRTRSYGESESAFDDRLRQARMIEESVLRPYVQELVSSKSAVLEAEAAYTECSTAARTLNNQRGY